MRRVVVLDDEHVLRFVLAEALRDAGFEVTPAERGQDVLAALGEGALPDAIVVDLLMKGMTGKQFLEALRAQPAWTRIPVVLITGAVYSRATFPPRDAYQAMLQKPFSLRSLVAAVEGVLPP